jgi:hypothetical protein
MINHLELYGFQWLPLPLSYNPTIFFPSKSKKKERLLNFGKKIKRFVLDTEILLVITSSQIPRVLNSLKLNLKVLVRGLHKILPVMVSTILFNA